LCFTCFATGLRGFHITLVVTVNAMVLMFGNEKKDVMRCFCFLFPIFCSFFSSPEKKPLFAGQLFPVPGPGGAERSFLYVGSICWASVFFLQICSIVMVMVMVTTSAGVFEVGLSEPGSEA